MAKIVEYRNLALDDLVIGKGQARTDNPGRDADELVESIKAQGLLQPIVVCDARDEGKWEILAGQRRFLAYRLLELETIPAAILDGRVEEKEAKAISLTENLLRRKLSGKELTDGLLYLYNIYGSAKVVSKATGLPYDKVRQHVNYPRLSEDLKPLVDSGEVDLQVALRAQDATEDGDDTLDSGMAVNLAKQMQSMSGIQRKNVTKIRKQKPYEPIEEVLEEAKTGKHSIQVVATVSLAVHQAITEVAKEEKINQDEATATLIEDALRERGLLDS